ncbi:hypothetical protein Ahy_B03g065145 [Arachis hypogaea]|uniref:Myb/SANT-like domain-containing protein n=1 Tax=Arachis hypogaea TaxID=3818 RepID=A0A445A0V4_ARAHY|nr:hypothetical protein Ahy_B03g065145 [Arachis hypogaea]
MFHEKIPGCDLKDNPHIESRVKLLKRQYFAIVEMMGTTGSGFGWNDKDKMIVSHSNANGLYNKPFPYFEVLGIAFGRDRAQGGNAENESPTPGVPAAPGAFAAPSFSSIERNKRKRGSKNEEVIDIVAESIRDMKGAYQKHTAILVDMFSCFKHEKEGVERRMKLMALLRDVPDLNVEDRMKVGLSIIRDNSLIDMLLQLQPGELLPFLKKLI